MKYIIEFEDMPSFAEDGIAYYQCRQVPWWFVGDSHISRLTSAQDILYEIDKIDQKVDEAYQRGLEDGKWKSEDGCTGCKYEGKVVTGPPCISCCNSYKNQWTAKDDKIEVGDEVRHDRGWTAVVTSIDNVGLSAMDYNGEVASYSDISKFTKTGRHFDIPEILEEMKK